VALIRQAKLTVRMKNVLRNNKLQYQLSIAADRTMADGTPRNTELGKWMIYKFPFNNDLACRLSFFLGCEKNLLVLDTDDGVL